MHSQKTFPLNEGHQSLFVMVNKAPSSHSARFVFSPQFHVYQCSTSENLKSNECPSASDALKELEQLLKKYNQGYKTEIEYTIVGPIFNRYYHSIFKRFVICNAKGNEKDILKLLKKLNNKQQIKLSRKCRKEKKLKPNCATFKPCIPKKILKKINHELSKNPITALDNNKNQSNDIANLCKCMCSRFNNDDSKKIGTDTPNVPVKENLNKPTVDTKSTNIKDNKNLMNNENDEEIVNCVTNQPDTNMICSKKTCFKNFRARLSQKAKERTACICKKKSKKLRQKGTNTYEMKNFATAPHTTKATNCNKPHKNKNKGTNTKTSDNNHNFNNLPTNRCENCLLLQNLKKNIALNTYTKDLLPPRDMEFYACSSNKDIFKTQAKCISRRNNIENEINMQDIFQKEKPKHALCPFRKKCEPELDNCNKILLELFQPVKKNKVVLQTVEESCLQPPANKTKPICCHNAKVQTDKKSLNCTRKDKIYKINKKSIITDRDAAVDTNIYKNYDHTHGFIKKILNFCRITEGKKTRTRDYGTIKLSSFSIRPNCSRARSLFAHKNKGIKLTIGRVAEELRRSLGTLNPVTPLDFICFKNEIDLNNDITYETDNLSEVLSENNSIYREESFICNLDITIEDTSNKISFYNLELKCRLPSCITLIEPTTSCISTIYNISNNNKSLVPYQAPKYDEYLTNTCDLKWNNVLSGIHVDCSKQLIMQIIRSRHELRTATNLLYYQENVGYETKYIGTMPPNTVVRDITKIKTKFYFEWLNIQEYNYLIGSSHNLKTFSIEDNHSQIKREKQAESKFCLYLLQCHDEEAAQVDMNLPLIYPQSEHTCCIQDLFAVSEVSNCESFDIDAKPLPKCTACTSCQLQPTAEPNDNIKIRRKLIKKSSLKPMKCKKTITRDGSLHLTCDYNTTTNKKHKAMWSKRNQKSTNQCDDTDIDETEVFLGFKNEDNETPENDDYELTFSDFERMSERQLRCIISQLSKAICPSPDDMDNDSDDTVDISPCLEKSHKRQGIKFFVQPNDLYSNKLLRFFITKKTK